MIQRREHLRFTLKTGQTFRIAGEDLRQDLDPHVAAEPRVPCTIHPMPPVPRGAWISYGPIRVPAERPISSLLEKWASFYSEGFCRQRRSNQTGQPNRGRSHQ